MLFAHAHILFNEQFAAGGDEEALAWGGNRAPLKVIGDGGTEGGGHRGEGKARGGVYAPEGFFKIRKGGGVGASVENPLRPVVGARPLAHGALAQLGRGTEVGAVVIGVGAEGEEAGVVAAGRLAKSLDFYGHGVIYQVAGLRGYVEAGDFHKFLPRHVIEVILPLVLEEEPCGGRCRRL